MTSPQPIQNPPFAPTGPSGPGSADYRGVLGANQQQQQTEPAMDAERMRQRQIDNVGSQLKSIGDSLDSIARQFPIAAQEVQGIQRSLTGILVKIVGSSVPASQPSTGAMG